MVEKGVFYEHLHAVQEKLLKGSIMVMLGDQNAKMGCVNTSLKHVMGKHGIGDHYDNDWRIADFSCFHRFVIGGTSFELVWVSTDRHYVTNWIDHFASNPPENNAKH